MVFLSGKDTDFRRNMFLCYTVNTEEQIMEVWRINNRCRRMDSPELILKILLCFFASCLRGQKPRLTCQQHPGACPTWQGRLTACRRPLASPGTRTVLALRLEVQHQVDRIGDSIGCGVRIQLGTPLFLHLWTANTHTQDPTKLTTHKTSRHHL